MNELLAQFINLLGAVLLMLAFAMISQRRILSLIALFTLQGAVLVLSTVVVGVSHGLGTMSKDPRTGFDTPPASVVCVRRGASFE